MDAYLCKSLVIVELDDELYEPDPESPAASVVPDWIKARPHAADLEGQGSLLVEADEEFLGWLKASRHEHKAVLPDECPMNFGDRHSGTVRVLYDPEREEFVILDDDHLWGDRAHAPDASFSGSVSANGGLSWTPVSARADLAPDGVRVVARKGLGTLTTIHPTHEQARARIRSLYGEWVAPNRWSGVALGCSE
jgi:hypothetical protein